MRDLAKRLKAIEARRVPKCNCSWNVYWVEDPDAPNRKPPDWVKPCPLHGAGGTAVSWRGAGEIEHKPL